MKNEKTVTKLSEIIDDALCDRVSARYSYDKHQPNHFSWIHFFWSYGGLASEHTSSLEYADAEEFQEQLIKVVKKVFTPSNLEYIRKAKLTEFGMHIGPYQPSGGSINDEIGIEVIPEMKDRGE